MKPNRYGLALAMSLAFNPLSSAFAREPGWQYWEDKERSSDDKIPFATISYLHPKEFLFAIDCDKDKDITMEFNQQKSDTYGKLIKDSRVASDLDLSPEIYFMGYVFDDGKRQELPLNVVVPSRLNTNADLSAATAERLKKEAEKILSSQEIQMIDTEMEENIRALVLSVKDSPKATHEQKASVEQNARKFYLSEAEEKKKAPQRVKEELARYAQASVFLRSILMHDKVTLYFDNQPHIEIPVTKEAKESIRKTLQVCGVKSV